jgi:hypothetical protein
VRSILVEFGGTNFSICGGEHLHNGRQGGGNLAGVDT